MQLILAYCLYNFRPTKRADAKCNATHIFYLRKLRLRKGTYLPHFGNDVCFSDHTQRYIRHRVDIAYLCKLNYGLSQLGILSIIGGPWAI